GSRSRVGVYQVETDRLEFALLRQATERRRREVVDVCVTLQTLADSGADEPQYPPWIAQDTLKALRRSVVARQERGEVFDVLDHQQPPARAPATARLLKHALGIDDVVQRGRDHHRIEARVRVRQAFTGTLDEGAGARKTQSVGFPMNGVRPGLVAVAARIVNDIYVAGTRAPPLAQKPPSAAEV